MKILLVNKFWYHHGGADRYVLWLADRLREQGHEIVGLSVDHEQNIDPPYPLTTIPHVQTERLQLNGALRTVGRMFWSVRARKEVRALIEREKPDIAHIHNVYTQMSPSLLPVIHELGIPSVMTVHDYHLVSPNYSLFDAHGIDTVGSFASVIRRRGIKRSFVASLLAATAFSFHKHFGLYHHHIDRLIFSSHFVQQLFRHHGWEGDKGTVIPMFAELEQHELEQEDEGYVLFVGRLHATKGSHVLIEAARQTGVPVNIVGDGPDLQKLREQAGAMTNITFLGARSHKETLELMRRARVVVVPSIWWEPFGMVSIEAQALGTPVIVSDIGGLAETVSHGQTGFKVPPGEVQDLAHALQFFSDDPEKAAHMGRLARRRYEALYTPEIHMKKLVGLYEEVIGEVQSSK